MNEKVLTLQKLLRHGALTPDEARVTCGWAPDVFEAALRAGMEAGLIVRERHPNNATMTHIAAVGPIANALPMNRAERRAAAKRKTTRTPRRSASPLAALYILDNARPHEPGEKTDRHIKTRFAFASLKDGTATQEDFDCVAMTINICAVRALQIDEAMAATLSRAQDAMNNCRARRERTGRFGFAGPEMPGVAESLDYCEAIIDASSPLQMRSARRIVTDTILGRGAWREVERRMDAA